MRDFSSVYADQRFFLKVDDLNEFKPMLLNESSTAIDIENVNVLALIFHLGKFIFLADSKFLFPAD